MSSRRTRGRRVRSRPQSPGWRSCSWSAVPASCWSMLSPELRRFVDLFIRWNERINLSAARTVDEVTLQVVDCLALVPYVEGPRVLDVGSGGGLPGLILALSMPHIRVLSLEPVHKKAAFQSTAIRELGIGNAEVQARRVDQVADTGFDTAVSRATFDLTDWLELG